MRNLCCYLFILLAVLTANVQALPIEDADAFVVGDRKAIYEVSSGLTWLDFGINNNRSFSEVMAELDSGQYVGWRLPSEFEVLHLFKGLLPEFQVPDTLTDIFQDQIQTDDFELIWDEIYSLWGVNDPKPDRGEGNGHQLFSYSSVGFFIGENGALYSTGLHEFTFGAEIEPGNNYYGHIILFNILEGNFSPNEINIYASTLLVRDTPIKVAEPNIFMLFMSALGFVLINLLKRKRQYQ
ncbi:MAG: hypothetical protein B0W54_03055 [Cellvibrio sp. 79]|nr:MAG: hypothetical protein B0W54_03055 [Cellvibrio sp. 79]